MKRTQLYIDSPTYQLALLQAKQDGTSVSDIVRRSIKHYVEPKQKRSSGKNIVAWIEALNRKYPSPPGTPTDISSELDHYLYGTPKKYSSKSK